jgi:hypothetical protein
LEFTDWERGTTGQIAIQDVDGDCKSLPPAVEHLSKSHDPVDCFGSVFPSDIDLFLKKIGITGFS